MKNMPRKTVNMRFGTIPDENFNITSYVVIEREGEEDGLFMEFELDKDNKDSPYPSHDLTKDEVKHLIKLLEEAL